MKLYEIQIGVAVVAADECEARRLAERLEILLGPSGDGSIGTTTTLDYNVYDVDEVDE